MIDIKRAEEEFKKYTSKYDMDEQRLYRKVTHTFRVEELCGELAISLRLNEEEINLAKIIGLLHDIARFEQYTKYKTFSDLDSIDHGDLGVEILEENQYIRRYIETDQYDNIIMKAIANHNKYNIESNLNNKERLFCKIIRDADKLDIMYQATNQRWKNNIKDLETQEVSKKVLEQFFAKQIINKKDVENDIDRLIVNIAFIYDFNFKESYKIIKENEYINNIINRFNFEVEETREQIELIRKKANDYVDNQIENKNN